MFKVENTTIPDGRCGQTLPRQLGVSYEPRQHSGQVHTEPGFIGYVFQVTMLLVSVFM